MTYGAYPFYNYNPYNPSMATQQRINQLESQYAQFTQNQQGQLNALPVSDIAEANAYRVDINGAPTLFFNAGKNEVYLKRTNTQTGAADFFIFRAIASAKTEEKNADNVNISKEDLKAINDKLDTLCGMLENKPTKKGVKNDE